MDASIRFMRRIIPHTQTEFLVPSTWILNGAIVDMDFVNNRYWSSPDFVTDPTTLLSISRASTGYAKTSAGALTSFASNTLRITNLGLLLEEASTNLIDHSQDFSVWFVFGTTITANDAVAPDGTTTMTKLAENTDTGGHGIVQNLAGGTTTDAYTGSIFIKDINRRYIGLTLDNNNTEHAYFYAVFDLQTATIVNSGTINPATGTSFVGAIIEPFINSTYRLSITGQTGGTPNAASLDLTVFMMTGPNFPADSSYTGSTSNAVEIWGGQIELNTFPTRAYTSSYILTTTTSATRAEDRITCLGNLSTVLATLPQSTFADVILYYNSLFTVPNQWRIFGDSATGATPLFAHSGLSNEASMYNGSSILDALMGNSLTWFTGAKVASGQNSGGRSVVGGGGTVATDSNAGVAPTTPTLGDTGVQQPFGYFRRIAVWNSKLSDATLQSLTAP